MITVKGLAELHAAQTLQPVGSLSAWIDQVTYAMTFDLAARTGAVVVNRSFVKPKHLIQCIDSVLKVFAHGYGMENRLAVLPPGEQVGELIVPSDKVGFCTVCCVTIDGVLLKHGIPTTSRLGGLLELRNRRPVRFVEMTYYDGTTIDRLEVFIPSGMTRYARAAGDGNGPIGASFREMPEDARDLVQHLADRLAAIVLVAFLEIGLPGQLVLGLPVSAGRIGSVVAGGLNPIAVFEEIGYPMDSRALAGLLDYRRLISFEERPQRVKQFV